MYLTLVLPHFFSVLKTNKINARVVLSKQLSYYRLTEFLELEGP